VVRGGNDAVELVLHEPAPGAAREIVGELSFPVGSRARRATVQQIVVAQRVRGRPVDAGQIAAHLDLGAAVTIELSEQATRFTMTVPRATRTFVGPTYSFAVGVAVVPDVGSPLRLIVDVPPPDDARLEIRDLPHERSSSRPVPFFVGAALVGAFAASAIWLRGAALAAMLVVAVVGVLVAAGFRRGMRGFVRLGVVGLRLDAADGGAGTELAVTARSRRAAGGRARVVAVEYEVERGHAAVLAELADREAPFEPQGDGVWTARVPLPPADLVPPSIALGAPRRTVAIRWLARIELVPAGGGAPAEFDVPLTVVVEPVPAST
jgi:hypothetical protein